MTDSTSTTVKYVSHCTRKFRTFPIWPFSCKWSQTGFMPWRISSQGWERPAMNAGAVTETGQDCR